jgi:prolyl oligopeptidase
MRKEVCRRSWRIVSGSLMPVLLASLPLSPAIAQRPAYPPTRRGGVVDDYHGVRVADPYRWLEQLDSPATRAWLDSQRRLTRDRLDRLPGHEAIRRRLTALSRYGRTEVPWREAGHLFYLENPGGRPQPLLYARRDVAHPAVVVLDPQTLSADGSTAVGDFAVSPDGRWLAYSMSPGGADAGETHVRDLTTGRDRADVVRGTRGTACWTFDGGGFFYMRPPAAESGAAAGAARVEKQWWYHRLGRSQAADTLLHQWTDNYRWLYCMLSDDGRWAFAVAERGAASWMYSMDLRRPKSPDLTAPLVPLLGDREANHTPLGTVGDTLYVRTDLDAPRGRIVALTLTDGAAARPRTVIPEGPDVIENATVAGHGLAVHYLVDVTSRLRRFTLEGRPAGEIALPGLGAVEWPLNGRASAPELLYGFTSFLTPATVFYGDLRRGTSTPFQPPRVPFDTADYQTRQVFYRSNDGTRVPMFLTMQKGLRLDGSHPVMLTGYGGFGTTREPGYEPQVPWWLEAGGIYAVANIRGGGEYGEEWHRAGNRERKQQSFDDFIAAAEYLVREGYTSPQRLAIYGHSNGGLLVGAVLTQRPDLFAVAVANAGHYDMLRFHKFTVGAGWIPEYGSPDDPAAFRWLRAYSPLHHVRAGVCYPATLLLTGDHDDRVVPSHAYKFAATLQAAQRCDHPILLRVASDASHSYASASGGIAEWTDVWGFVAAQLGMPPPQSPAAR